MPIATLTKIEKTFGRRVLFDGLEFIIDRGERVGLIGDNGSGKSTLFKVLTGELVPDSGTVAVAKSIAIGHLRQEAVFETGNTVMDEAELAFAALHKLAHEMREMEHDMGERQGAELEKVLEKYQETQHEFELAGGYAWQHRLEATLLGVGLMRQAWEQEVTTLSGGQRSRLALAKLLISEPDLLLLDEPTNHLDLAAIAWLEEYLNEFSGAVLLISHDRYLLDRLATRIVWLNNSKLASYPGNYSAFGQQRAMQELSQRRAYEEQQADIAKQAEFVRRFKAGQRAREAKGREKRLERLLKSDAMVAAVGQNHTISLSMQSDQRAGDRVLRVKELSKAYGEKVLWKGLKFEIERGERIGIIGPNASGKTTLLEVLLGRREADAGEIRWGANLAIGYYDQKLDEFDPENTVEEEVRGDRIVKDQDLRNILALMLFRGETIEKPMGLLSGGERARVAMAQLLLDKPNLLVLDEPTNHLDIASCEALEAAMNDFPGTVLCVSHDRYFLDKVVKRLLVLRPPGMVDFGGNYSAWAVKLVEEARPKAAATKTAQAKAKHQEAKRQESRHQEKQGGKPERKRENAWARPFGRLSTEELERQITDTEIAIAECHQRFGRPGAEGKLKGEYEGLVKKLKELEEEYFLRGEKGD